LIKNFSCVDKNGVLSWPNPIAERIWFFTNISNQSKSNDNISSEESPNAQYGSPSANVDNGVQIQNSSESRESEIKVDENSKKQLGGEKSFLETYNLTHDNSNGYELKFDDTNWTRNINTLKPIVIFILFIKDLI